MTAKQVRLEEDVWRRLDADRDGRSLSSEANRVLRATLREAEQAPVGRPPAVRAVQRVTPTRRQIGRCRHPRALRVGSLCTACGSAIA